jgi:predicted metal-dependent hydrolase
VQELQLVVAGRPVRAEVRESKRARRLRLVVRPDRRLELTVPPGTGARALRRFLTDSEGWIADRLDEAQVRAAQAHALGLARPGFVVLAGNAIPVARTPGARATATLHPGGLVVTGHEPGAAIERWYRREARSLLEGAAAREAARLGLAYSRIAVRDQRTRWGSCSTRGILSFNWRLALAPPQILEYVVVHELLHLREPNHSRAFWRLLDLHRPGWPAQAAWLRDHGEELLAYRPSGYSTSHETHGDLAVC